MAIELLRWFSCAFHFPLKYHSRIFYCVPVIIPRSSKLLFQTTRSFGALILENPEGCGTGDSMRICPSLEIAAPGSAELVRKFIANILTQSRSFPSQSDAIYQLLNSHNASSINLSIRFRIRASNAWHQRPSSAGFGCMLVRASLVVYMKHCHLL